MPDSPVMSLEQFDALRPHFEKSVDNRLHAARESFQAFMLLYMSHLLTIKPAQFQLDSYARAKERRLLEVWPRGFGKSRTWSIGYPLWVVLNNPYGLNLKLHQECIALISCAGDLPEEWIWQHKFELTENARIVEDYKPVQGDIWRADHIKFSSRVGRGSIISKGSGAQVRGQHPTEIVVDDLENRQECESDTQRAHVRRYFWRDLYGTLRDGNQDESQSKMRMKVIGTIVHPQALLVRLLNKEGWVKVKHSVYKADGTALWPEYMDIGAIEAKRKELEEEDPGAFSSEYLNNPIVSENPIFVEPWMRRYDAENEVSWLKEKQAGVYTGIAVDPAISRREGSDYTAITVCSATYDEKAKFYFRRGGVVRGRWPIHKTIAEVQRLYELFDANFVIFETTAFQQALSDEFKRHSQGQSWYPRVIEVKPDKDKERRAHAVAPLFERSQVFFDESDVMHQKMIDEMLVFPTGDFDDLTDAGVMVLAELKRWQGRERGAQKGPQIVLKYEPRNAFTGVN